MYVVLHNKISRQIPTDIFLLIGCCTEPEFRPKRAAKSHVISFRLTSEEISTLELITRSYGLSSRNAAIRTPIRASGGLIEADQERTKNLLPAYDQSRQTIISQADRNRICLNKPV